MFCFCYLLFLFVTEEEKETVSDEERKEASPEVLEAQIVGKRARYSCGQLAQEGILKSVFIEL